jgi:hypothetical protein
MLHSRGSREAQEGKLLLDQIKIKGHQVTEGTSLVYGGCRHATLKGR